jgi:hypothetical protein
VEEAEENARAGHASLGLPSGRVAVMGGLIDQMKASLCSRCGFCDSLCSKHLPVSWLFRDAYITHFPSETFETVDQNRYFNLHPGEIAACSTCREVTCSCPYGIDIPRSLIAVHTEMLARREQGVLPDPPPPAPPDRRRPPFAAAMVTREIPRALRPGESAICRLFIENTGAETWIGPRARGEVPGVEVELEVHAANLPRRVIALRGYVEPGTRTHFAFEVRAPETGSFLPLRLALRSRGRWLMRPLLPLVTETIAVSAADPAGVP